MNNIIRHPRNELGYNFIAGDYLPKGKDENYLRNIQNPRKNYRGLRGSEIEILIRNGNTSDDWGKILVSESFDPSLVKNSKFFGLIRIGKLEPYYLEYHNLRMPVGIYNSTVISTDIGDNVCIENITYLSHYIIGNEVMLANINELATTDYAKFGNGILKEGEDEKVRIWIELRNENGGRKIIPFNDMEPGDAMLWSDYPEDEKLQEKLLKMTTQTSEKRRGFYGTIGDRCVIKDCKIIKDVKIGSDAYIKGANKLKNLTINSNETSSSQIGEGCELVNGIVGLNCRVFYGVKAVRFIMGENSQLKYGARLINSYLGSNSTISCCEVLNSLIFPGHEQHHNNSFLTAALTMGQSNIAAGATIGSNHNSRAADGEMIAGRGFWPGLCVSLKHNSKFASFCILVKGNYPHEINVPIPFTLVSNNESRDRLELRPGYWFRHNMYALSRNEKKYLKRNGIHHAVQTLEYDSLAPDSVNEMFEALRLMEGLETDEKGNAIVSDIENSKRICEIKRVPYVIGLFKELIIYYGVANIIHYINENNPETLDDIRNQLQSSLRRTEWGNLGGQLIQKTKIKRLVASIKTGKISSWDEVHQFYKVNSSEYGKDKFLHAVASLLEIEKTPVSVFDKDHLKKWLQQAVVTRTWMTKGVYESRKKDYDNPFRKMIYSSEEQMDKVMGKLEDNDFISENAVETKQFKATVRRIIKKYC